MIRFNVEWRKRKMQILMPNISAWFLFDAIPSLYNNAFLKNDKKNWPIIWRNYFDQFGYTDISHLWFHWPNFASYIALNSDQFCPLYDLPVGTREGFEVSFTKAHIVSCELEKLFLNFLLIIVHTRFWSTWIAFILFCAFFTGCSLGHSIVSIFIITFLVLAFLRGWHQKVVSTAMGEFAFSPSKYLSVLI